MSMTIREALENLIANLPSECICIEAYTSRKLHDPQCWYCDIKHELDIAKAALRDNT